jgi:hypothetical protein
MYAHVGYSPARPSAYPQSYQEFNPTGGLHTCTLDVNEAQPSRLRPHSSPCMEHIVVSTPTPRDIFKCSFEQACCRDRIFASWHGWISDMKAGSRIDIEFGNTVFDRREA